MEADGQDHDRMETDVASETSGSGAESPQHDQQPATPASVDTPPVPDAEAMDTTPDPSDPGETVLPSSPRAYYFLDYVLLAQISRLLIPSI